MMKRQRTLKQKLVLLVILACSGLVIGGGVSYYSLAKVVELFTKVTAIHFKGVGHVSGLRARSKQLHTDSLRLALFQNDPTNLKLTLESLDKSKKRYAAIEAEYEADLKGLDIPEEREKFGAVHAQGLKVLAGIEHVLELHRAAAPDTREKIMAYLASTFEAEVALHQKILLELDDYHVDSGNQLTAAAAKQAQASRMLILILSGVIIVISMGAGMLLARSINRAIEALAERLSKSAKEVAEASRRLSTISTDLSSNITTEAACVQETLAATDQVQAMIQRNNENSTATLARAENSQRVSQTGQEALVDLLQSISEMGKMNQDLGLRLRSSGDEVAEMVKLICDIATKTKVIDEIVFQTKLLSFNASVEAARAGVAGKGFAVVAEEVGNLATMSGQASREISEMLSQSTVRAQAIVDRMRSSVDQMLKGSAEINRSGTQKAENCRAALNEIFAGVRDMNDMVKQIVTASSEQTVGMNEIAKAMNKIDSATTENSSSAGECSSAAEQLKQEAEHSQETVGELMSLIVGSRAA